MSLGADVIFIDSIDDPRVAVYRDLKDRELASREGRFIAESAHVVRRLLASDFEVESVLVGQRRAEEMREAAIAKAPLYVLPDAMVNEVVGFKFHSGVIACGRRKRFVSLADVLPRKPIAGAASTIVICPDLISHENLGSLIRISSAFGVDAIILGERCCDPFYRMSIRVSMGTIFNMPIARSENLRSDLVKLRGELEYELAATVLDEDAEPLSQAKRGQKLGILFGNEAQGLAPDVVALCDRRVTIPMKRGTDSLNITIAAGVFLYHFTGSAER